MTGPHSAVHWGPVGPSGWTVRFFTIPGCAWPCHDHDALGQCLGLRPKHVRSAGARGVQRIDAFNARGEVRTIFVAPPAAAAALIAKARELGRPGVDAVEADFSATFHAAVGKMEGAAA